MANISLDLNLAQLKHIEREFTGKNGNKVKCIVIPYEENDIYVGEKIRSLKMTAIEVKDRSKFKDTDKTTHLIKPDVPKDKYDAMSEYQRKSLPILGNAVYWGKREPVPQQSESISESSVDQYFDESADGESDLPF